MYHHIIKGNYKKIQWLKQGSKSVEHYYKDFETLRILSYIWEDKYTIITRFLDGQSYDIKNVFELQYFMNIEELVHKSSTMEQQSKRKNAYKRYSSNKD